MSRKNKILVLPIHQFQKGIDDFIKVDEKLNPLPNEELSQYIESYIDVLKTINEDIDYLARLEEVITQIRCQHQIRSEIKLYVSQVYIYARSTFFRRECQIKDIRVPLGTIKELGDDLDKLSKDDQFMENARGLLFITMNNEIKENIKSLMMLEKVEENLEN